MDLPIIKRNQVAAEIVRRLFGHAADRKLVGRRVRKLARFLGRRRADIRNDASASGASAFCAWMAAVGFAAGLLRAIGTEPTWIFWCAIGLVVSVGIAINQRGKRRAFLFEARSHEDPTIEEELHRIRARLRDLQRQHPRDFPPPQ